MIKKSTQFLVDTQTFARHLARSRSTVAKEERASSLGKAQTRSKSTRDQAGKEKRNWQKTVNNCPFPQTTKKEVTEKWTYYLNFRWETLTVMAKRKLKGKDPC